MKYPWVERNRKNGKNYEKKLKLISLEKHYSPFFTEVIVVAFRFTKNAVLGTLKIKGYLFSLQHYRLKIGLY